MAGRYQVPRGLASETKAEVGPTLDPTPPLVPDPVPVTPPQPQEEPNRGPLADALRRVAMEFHQVKCRKPGWKTCKDPVCQVAQVALGYKVAE